MWSYYGAKTNIVHVYPPPKYGKIIEPFAGTARYSCKYWDREVILVDAYPVIAAIWKWLQVCSKADIEKLPRFFKQGERIDKINFDCQEAKWLVGFLIGKGIERPREKVVDRITKIRPNAVNFQLKRIANSLEKIRHWQIVEGSYVDIPNQDATWFIDPPYQFGGNAYVVSNKKLNFPELAAWCKSRQGQVMVCENTKADWMNFKPMVLQKGSVAKTTEAIWTNFSTSFDMQQQKLF